MKFKNNGGPCAACKSQRRRCSPDCQLAPFFPSDQPKRFEDARKLFGVRNIIKNLKRVGDDPVLRAETMWALTYESSLRAQDKAHGATGEIIKLCCEIQQTQLELDRVRAEIAMNKVHYDGVMDYLGSFVGDSNGGISNELKVFWADQNFDGDMAMYLANTDEEETITKSDQPSFDSPLKSELEPLLNMEIENELKNAAAFLGLTSNVKTEKEIFPFSEDF